MHVDMEKARNRQTEANEEEDEERRQDVDAYPGAGIRLMGSYSSACIIVSSV